LICDLVDSPDVRNISEATQRPWMIDHVVHRGKLLVAIVHGRPEKIRLYFLDPTEKYISKGLFRLAMERLCLMALRALLVLGAVLSPADVQLAEGFPNPFHRLALREIAKYETTYKEIKDMVLRTRKAGRILHVCVGHWFAFSLVERPSHDRRADNTSGHTSMSEVKIVLAFIDFLSMMAHWTQEHLFHFFGFDWSNRI
jgi:hypothetical protein